MNDKDGTFLVKMEDEVHLAWGRGEITNFLRSLLLNSICDARDAL